MDALNFNHLFWLRHGDYNRSGSESLSDKGRRQMRCVADNIISLLAMEDSKFIAPFASNVRRAIETVFAIQDAFVFVARNNYRAVNICETLCTDRVFYSASSSLGGTDRIVSIMNSETRGCSNCLAVAHDGAFLKFPHAVFPGIELPEESNVGDMIHVNLKTGESEYFSSDNYNLNVN